jgi:RNA polymerase sigma-70 factor (ECF subfamily)
MTSEDQRTAQFVQLLSRHERRLNAYILSLVPNWSDAEDLTQEVKTRLWQQFGEYDADKDFGAWSRAVAYYFVLTHRRCDGKRPKTFPDDLLELVSHEASSVSDELELRHLALENCLQKLADCNRSLVLRWYAGKEPGRVIAQSTGRSFEATRKLILRIRQLLSRCVQTSLTQEAQ